MKKVLIISGIVALAGVTLFGMSRCDKKPFIQEDTMLSHITSVDDLKKLFALRVSDIQAMTDRYIEETKKNIQAIIAIPAAQRTFANTMTAFDRLNIVSNIDLFAAVSSVLKEVSPDAAIREATQNALMQLASFSVDWISGNVELYNAIKAYAQGNGQHETLRADERYFLDETIKSFKRSGLDLPKDQLEEVKKLQKELIDLGLKFSSNIAQDNRTITVSKDALAGVAQDFVDALKKTDDGMIIIGVDYPTYFSVMENCTVESTRKALHEAYLNRAYPANVQVLQTIITKRDDLAYKLGFASYAHLNLDSEMAKTPERAQQFINDLLEKLNVKEQAEFDLLTKNLPAGVTLTADGKFKSWDVLFVHNMYRKHNLAVDEEKIAEYFQLEPTLSAMFALYENFFHVKFKPTQEAGFWHPEVKLFEVHDGTTDALLAYMLLDLHPRPNKYSHAAHFGVLPGFVDGGNEWPAISFVVANFSKSTATKPSLLQRKEVSTLFHEFGHAMHHILGKTQIVSFAGTSCKHDFVEVPSQMLEEWLWDKEVLKRMSKHYVTGDQLPDAMINNIIALQQFDRGYFWQRQSFLATVSIAYYLPGAHKDLAAVWQSTFESIIRHVAHNPAEHQYAGFGHLPSYSARYYGYMWADVLALDIFESIKEQGLLKPGAGERYVEAVLSKGGSCEPEEMMRDFLGREPNNEAFLKHAGLSADVSTDVSPDVSPVVLT